MHPYSQASDSDSDDDGGMSQADESYATRASRERDLDKQYEESMQAVIYSALAGVQY